MPSYSLGLYTAATEMILEKSPSNAKNYLFFLAAKHILLLKMYREMKNWWRNKGQFAKNGHLELVCYTSKKQPDFSQELDLCQLPGCSRGKTGSCGCSENLLGACVLLGQLHPHIPAVCAALRINGKSKLKLPLGQFLSQLFPWSSCP